MATERWRRIESAFVDAAKRPVSERDACLDRHCGADLELRAEVEALLAADGRGGRFIEDAIEADAAAFTGGGGLGPRLGPYRLIRRLGRGGMCSVFLAVRVDAQFRKLVAIKVVRRGMDTRDILRRFRMERQILAGLDHPNIARLLDGGTTDGGRPFFILEYIDGLAIDTYCDQHRLNVPERLRLFRAVCHAVHYAHRNLVVHRDIKPSNVLVTPEGVPKLLDFGIAKLLNPELTEATLAPTGHQQRLMTPHYASPEQVTGGAITTASDVYSLGVLLYELLIARRPFRTAGESKRVQDLIRHQPPERPSAAISRTRSRSDPGVDEVANARRATTDQLRRTLRGDLDTIVLRTLRKEPSRRYGSAEQLAEDLERYENGLPVIARRDTITYRTAKFIQRHRLGTAAGLTIAGLIVALFVTLAVQSSRVRRERDRARQTAALVSHLFEIADPGTVRGSTIAASELLDRGAERIARHDDTLETGRLLDTLARLYEKLGLYARAVPLRRRVLRIYRQEFAPVSEEIAIASSNLGRTLAWKGDFVASEPLFREALGIFRQRYTGAHARILAGISNLALVLHDLGDLRRAGALYEEGMSLQRQTGEQDLFLLANRALLHYDVGEYQDAEAIYRHLLEHDQRTLGRDHEDTAYDLDELGMALHASGRSADGEALVREALAIRLRRLGDDHLDVARNRTHLGRILTAGGTLEEAETLLRQAFEQRLALRGDQHPDIADSLEALAAWRTARGDLDEAEGLYRRALAIYRTALPEQHPQAAESMLGLGRLLAGRGNHAEAEPLLREAVAIRRRQLPEGSPLITAADDVLARYAGPDQRAFHGTMSPGPS